QREAQIELALTAIRTGEVNSVRAAERAYNIPESTLRARLNGTTNRQEFLIKWILEQDAQGFPPTHARTREIATRILRINGDNQELRNKFVTKFIRDNPRIASVVRRPIEAARINRTNPEAIQEFYTLYEDITRRFHEHGIAVSICTNIRVLTSSKKRRSYVKLLESRE
ncbi:hypothetical protein D6C80_09323, partial [Aureobasidium pullulans]